MGHLSAHRSANNSLTLGKTPSTALGKLYLRFTGVTAF
jgi:hypothetical protein